MDREKVLEYLDKATKEGYSLSEVADYIEELIESEMEASYDRYYGINQD